LGTEVSPDQLEPGEEQPIELKALFNENVLEITEGTKVAAEILLEFSIKGVRYKDEHSETLRLYDRNATTWEDDRKAAAFVTAKDPVILKFSKNVVNAVKNKTSGSVNENLLHAIALHEAIAVYGMSYVVDPKTPYKEFSRKKQAVDFLQFPKQTLEYRAGDCDDLSIMYSALLEAVGIETAFITIPGHILMAFSLGMSPEEAKRVFSVADDLIFRDGKTWVPVEATQIEGGFLKAWQLGAKNWREGVLLKKEGFYPMHDSWTVYEPVGLPGEAEPLRLPSEDRLVVAYMGELARFIDREIYPI